MDFLALFNKMFTDTAQSYTLDDVGFFRSNAKMQDINAVYKDLLNKLGISLQDLANAFERTLTITSDVEITTTLDFWRNMLLGRSGDAHSHIMELVHLKHNVATVHKRSP